MNRVKWDPRGRWQPFMGQARIIWGLFTNDKWLQLEGRHQRRTSLLMKSTGFAPTDPADHRSNSAGMARPRGL
jgi:hypothetical protein